MDTHLGDGENEQCHGEPGSVDEVSASDPERSRCEPHRERESERVAAHFLAESPFPGGGFVAGQAVLADVRARIELVIAAHGSNSGGRVPTRYTRLKIATQMMSRACQKRLKQRNRGRIS